MAFKRSWMCVKAARKSHEIGKIFGNIYVCKKYFVEMFVLYTCIFKMTKSLISN